MGLALYRKDVQLALLISMVEHHGQVDKSGQPYIQHPYEVACLLPPHLQSAGLLHDVVEDTRMTLEHLEHVGFGDIDGLDVVAIVGAVTRDPDKETHAEFIDRVIGAGEDAIRVKIADCTHNLDETRREGVSDSLIQRTGKALYRLKAALEEIEAQKAEKTAEPEEETDDE